VAPLGGQGMEVFLVGQGQARAPQVVDQLIALVGILRDRYGGRSFGFDGLEEQRGILGVGECRQQFGSLGIGIGALLMGLIGGQSLVEQIGGLDETGMVPGPGRNGARTGGKRFGLGWQAGVA